MNLLVLKFLTMNTDDERREEFTREAQRNQSLRFSSADLLNVVNGNVICTFEPADLEDLRRENSLDICCMNKNSFINVVRRKLFRRNDSIEMIEQDEPMMSHYDSQLQRRRNKICCCLPFVSSTYVHQSTNNGDINSSPITARYSKNKRKHYTIRRSPGKIQHLLPLERLGSLISHGKANENKNVVNIEMKITNSDECAKIDTNKILSIENNSENLAVIEYIDQDDVNSNTEFDTLNHAQTTNTLLNTNTTTTNMIDINQHENDDKDKFKHLNEDDQSSLNDADVNNLNLITNSDNKNNHIYNNNSNSNQNINLFYV